MKARYITVGLGIGAVLFAVLSARLGISPLAFGVVGCAIVASILCIWGKLETRTMPYLVFLLGLAFLYQATLISNGLVGTDIHTEYYFYREALTGWDTTIPHAYNTAIGTTVIAPFLTNVLGIPGYWIYKAIFPFLFAFVPLILFIIYRKEFGDKVAFLGTLFFITLPTYTLEMIGIPRQMLGELMLALVLLLVIVRPIRLRYAVPLLCVAATMGYLFHYITGPAILLYLGGGSVIMLISKRRLFAVRWLFIVIIVSGVIGFAYYSTVADGVVSDNLSRGSRYAVDKVVNGGSVVEPTEPTDPTEPGEIVKQESWFVRYFSQQEPLLRTALGLDFMEASFTGKVFRILQFGTQLCLILGCVWLIRHRKKVSWEYIAFTVTAVALIAVCVVLPRFSNIINITRFYHLALFLVSPLLIVGGLYIFRDLKKLTLILLIPYMLFTTGLIFEAVQETDITKVNMPYSIALSNERVGMIGTYTENDLKVRDWALDQDYSFLFIDINGMLAVSEVADPFSYIYTPHHDFVRYPIESYVDRWGFIPYPLSRLPSGNYTCLIYLTEWNTQNQMVMFKPTWYNLKDTASGMRQSYSFEFVGLPGDFVEIYRQGDAVLLGDASLLGEMPKYGDPTSLSWVEKWTEDDDYAPDGHSQGAECDSTYLWWSFGDKLVRTYVANPDFDNPLAENNHAMTDGTDMEQINGIELQGDYIYATGTKFLATPYRCFVKWYDKLTLEFVGEQELTWDGGGSTQEGIVYEGGYWWACFFDRAAIAKYDTSFNYLGCESLPGQGVEIQGCEWFNGQLWVITATSVRVYGWDGSDFSLATSLSVPAQILHPQSIGICPEGDYLYWGDLTEVAGVGEVLHKCSISWEYGTLGNDNV